MRTKTSDSLRSNCRGRVGLHRWAGGWTASGIDGGSADGAHVVPSGAARLAACGMVTRRRSVQAADQPRVRPGAARKSDALMIEVSLTEQELLRQAASALDGSGGSSNRLLLRTGVHCATGLVVGAQLESCFGLALDPSYRQAIVRELKPEVPRFTEQLGELKPEQQVPRFTSELLEAHGGGTVQPEEVVRRLNRQPVLLCDGTGRCAPYQLHIRHAPSLQDRRGFKQLCEDCRRRAGLGKVAVVVVKCPSLDGRHAVAAFKVAGEHFQTVHAENSLGDAFYVTEQNYVRHLTLDVAIKATIGADGTSTNSAPPELLAYADTLERNRRQVEEAMGGVGEMLRQKDLALKEQREAREASAAAERALQKQRFVEDNIVRRQNLLRNMIRDVGAGGTGARGTRPPVPPALLHRIVASLPLSRSSSRLGLDRSNHGPDGTSVSFSFSDSSLSATRGITPLSHAKTLQSSDPRMARSSRQGLEGSALSGWRKRELSLRVRSSGSGLSKQTRTPEPGLSGW